MLVSLDNIKVHLGIDFTTYDSYITLQINAASEMIIDYLKNGADSFTDSMGETVNDSNGVAIGVPYKVQAACMLLVGYMFKNRDVNPDGAFQLGMLPNDVTAMLYSLRDPALR
jgi:hypothetical protein